MKTANVLIVDDNEALHSIYKELLHERGFTVATARNCEEAVSLCKQEEEIDVAIVDLKLPDMDGPDTIEALYRCNTDLRVIAISGQMLSRYFGRLADLGIRHFISKPFSIETLMQIIPEVYRPNEELALARG